MSRWVAIGALAAIVMIVGRAMTQSFPLPDVAPVGEVRPLRLGGPIRDAESYAVYAAVIQTTHADEHSGSPIVQIETNGPLVLEATGGPWRDVFARYNDANSSVWHIEASQPFNAPWRLWPQSDVDKGCGPSRPLDVKPGPDRGANVIIRLSAVGFSEDKTRAMVWVSFSCGGGNAEDLFFEKRNSVWIPTRPAGVKGRRTLE